ncbi:MAG TPA: hypothetical protein VFX49_21395, partial [Chloroflexota bacterium]|nr:hypothetical protein [Chloroflexota bacterium]
MTEPSSRLPQTGPLEAGDHAAGMVAGIGAFLDRALAEADATADAAPPATMEAHAAAAQSKRRELARIIGAVDDRVAPAGPEALQRLHRIPTPDTTPYDVFAVRWPVLGPVGGAEGMDGEGLQLEPRTPARATVVLLPDADSSPEQVAGLAEAHLASAGCRVVIPQLVNRSDDWSGNPHLTMTNQPHREFVYRMAFQLGRHIVGYEVQKVLALVDTFAMTTAAEPAPTPIALAGYGEGGLLALHAAALDPRIEVTLISGHFRNRRQVWREPIYRNVWRVQRGFSDAELAAMIAPRRLIVDASPGPTVDGPPPPREGRRTTAAPGTLAPAPIDDVRAEVARARRTYEALGVPERLTLVEPAGDA